MATLNFTANNVINFYGTNVLNNCVRVGNRGLAEQIVGLVPCVLDSDSCFTDCFVVPAFVGDFNSFLFNFVPTVTTADFRLFKLVGNTFVQLSVLSNIEGQKYEIGTIPGYPQYGGYLLDWDKVYTAYGEGTYQFWVYDNSTPLKSYPFLLKEGTCDDKDGTVKIESKNRGIYTNFKYTIDNGLILNFDLQTLDWLDSCRYYGKIIPTNLVQEIKEIRYSNSRSEIYFNEGFQEYDFNIFNCTFELYKRLNHFGLKALEVKATNDNLDREIDLIRKNVLPSGETKSEKFPNNKLLYQITIGLKDEFGDNYRLCD